MLVTLPGCALESTNYLLQCTYPMPSFYRHLLNYLQWGIGGQDNVIKTEVTFPIRFTRLFMANAIDAYWSGADTPRYFANSVSESNNTKAVFVASDKYAASYYWFALGII